MKRIDLATVAVDSQSSYPPPFNEPCDGQICKRLGRSQGLTRFGVNLTVIPPGCWSSQRHWHSHEDEFVYVLSGEVTLVSDSGTELLRAGDAAGFPGGVADGHCLQNRSSAEAVVLEVGSRKPTEDATTYPGIDLLSPADNKPAMFTRRDGTPYPNAGRRTP